MKKRSAEELLCIVCEIFKDKRAERDTIRPHVLLFLELEGVEKLVYIDVAAFFVNEAAKDLFAPIIRQAVQQCPSPPYALLFVSEAWTVALDDKTARSGDGISEHPDRKECVLVTLERAGEVTKAFVGIIENDVLLPWMEAPGMLESRWGDMLVDVEPATQKRANA